MMATTGTAAVSEYVFHLDALLALNMQHMTHRLDSGLDDVPWLPLEGSIDEFGDVLSSDAE